MKFLARLNLFLLSATFPATFLVTLLATTLVPSLALADVSKTEEYTFEIEQGGRISLSNVNGDVSIAGTEGRQVHIVATKTADNQEYLDGIKIDIDASPKAIRIETRYPGQGDWKIWGDHDSGSVEYTITLPRDVEIDSIDTVNSDVLVAGVAGSISAESVNGTLQVTDAGADVNAETVNGDIDVEFTQLGAGQKISMDAVNGRIVLRLPANASAQVSAETLNGSIDAGDFGLQADDGFVGHELDGKIGGGEARISIDTVNGPVKIKKRN